MVHGFGNFGKVDLEKMSHSAQSWKYSLNTIQTYVNYVILSIYVVYLSSFNCNTVVRSMLYGNFTSLLLAKD